MELNALTIQEVIGVHANADSMDQTVAETLTNAQSRMADVRMTVQTQLEAMNVHALTPNYHSPGINILVKLKESLSTVFKTRCP